MYDFEGESNYNSLQVTLSRQTSKRLQYFVTYTLSRTEGTLGDEYRNRDPFNPARTYGIRNEDRTHIFNLSWNAFLPDPIGENGNGVGKAFVNGWQLSGISTFASGIPIWLGFAGPAGTNGIEQAYYGTPDIQVLTGPGGTSEGLSPVYTCDPTLDGTEGRREDPRHQLHRLPGVRGGRRRAAAVRHPHARPHEPRHHAVQELRDSRATRSCRSASACSTSSTWPRRPRRWIATTST